MANTIYRSSCQGRVFHVFGLLCMMVLAQKSCGMQFTVGGAKGWMVPGEYNFNQWAEHNRFQIGDSLLFIYKPDQDSVLEVTKEDYSNCTTTAPITKLDDGHSVFTFSKSGPHYFISGNKDNCLKNEKLIVVVLADRSNRSSQTNETTTASPPSPAAGSTDMIPSASPPGEESPPSGTVEINPTPSPVTPPKNEATSMLASSIAFVGTVFASSLALVFY